MAYSIGSTSFDDLRGDVEIPAMQKEAETRVGQDGVAIFGTGKRGRPFALQSLYVVTTYAAAAALAVTYAESIDGLTPVHLVQGSMDYSTTSYKFVIMSVKSKIRSVPAFQNSRLSASPAFLVESEWVLQPVTII